jgi:hypothetical protein
VKRQWHNSAKARRARAVYRALSRSQRAVLDGPADASNTDVRWDDDPPGVLLTLHGRYPVRRGGPRDRAMRPEWPRLELALGGFVPLDLGDDAPGGGVLGVPSADPHAAVFWYAAARKRGGS